jgi:hypothetical protein
MRLVERVTHIRWAVRRGTAASDEPEMTALDLEESQALPAHFSVEVQVGQTLVLHSPMACCVSGSGVAAGWDIWLGPGRGEFGHMRVSLVYWKIPQTGSRSRHCDQP